MAEVPKDLSLGIELVQISKMDTSGDSEFELFEDDEPEDLTEAIGLAVGAASMTWPVIGGVFRDEKARRIVEQLEEEVVRLATHECNEMAGKAEEYRAALEAAQRTIRAMDSEWIPPQPVPPQLQRILDAVVSEYHRAKAKHGEMTLDGAGINDLFRLAALMEEVGEVAREMTYDNDNDENEVEAAKRLRLRTELIQVANVAATWASALIPRSAEPETWEAVPGAEAGGSGLWAGAQGLQPGILADAKRDLPGVVPGFEEMVAVMVPRDKLRAVHALITEEEEGRS